MSLLSYFFLFCILKAGFLGVIPHLYSLVFNQRLIRGCVQSCQAIFDLLLPLGSTFKPQAFYNPDLAFTFCQACSCLLCASTGSVGHGYGGGLSLL